MQSLATLWIIAGNLPSLTPRRHFAFMTIINVLLWDFTIYKAFSYLLFLPVLQEAGQWCRLELHSPYSWPYVATLAAAVVRLWVSHATNLQFLTDERWALVEVGRVTRVEVSSSLLWEASFPGLWMRRIEVWYFINFYQFVSSYSQSSSFSSAERNQALTL